MRIRICQFQTKGLRAAGSWGAARNVLAIYSLGLLLTVPAVAIQITPAAFTATAAVESFEGLSLAVPNVAASGWTGIVEPGANSAFTFASGATLSSPVPNPGAASNGAFVHDFAIGCCITNNWGANGAVASAADVVFGSAYLGAFDNLTGVTNPVSVELSFASAMGRVGGYITGGQGASVTLAAYAVGGALLESVSMPTGPVASWGSQFLGVERSEGIARVVVSGVDFGFDGLTFEAAPMVVPEPASALLLGFGMFGLAFWRRRGCGAGTPGRAFSGSRD